MDRLPTILIRAWRPDGDSGAEHGMTLIELLVAMIVLSIAGAMVVSILIQSMSGSGSARAGGISDAAIARTTAVLNDDVARAATRDSSIGAVRDEFSLSNSLRTGSPAMKPAEDAQGRADLSRPPVAADLDEVRAAEADRLQLIVGQQCITWRTASGTRGGRTTFELWRDTAPSCGAVPTQSKRFVTAEAGAPGLDTTPFRYRLLVGPVCQPSTVDGPTLTAVQRRWVIGVEAKIVSLVTAGKSAAAGQATAAQEIRIRSVDRYRKALGC